MRYTGEEGTKKVLRGSLALVVPRISFFEPVAIS